MATSKVSTILSFPSPSTPTISAQKISKYAEISALVTELESQKQSLRSELLALRSAGAEQEHTSPYLLQFVDQERKSPDWKAIAAELAVKVYGSAHLETWKASVEASAPVTPITQVRVKPNPAFAAGLARSVAIQ